jgi:Ca2+-binding EF-hand superfamily protein
MSEADAMKCFHYLDKPGDGYVDYNKFCELVEEKRRKIDPFVAEFTPKKTNRVNTTEPNSPRQEERINTYVREMTTEELDKMLKIHEK